PHQPLAECVQSRPASLLLGDERLSDPLRPGGDQARGLPVGQAYGCGRDSQLARLLDRCQEPKQIGVDRFARFGPRPPYEVEVERGPYVWHMRERSHSMMELS